MFKAKKTYWKGGYQLPPLGALITSADNYWPPPLPFHTTLKIPQPKIFMLYQHTSLSQIHSLTHIDKHTHTHTHIYAHTHTQAHRDVYKKAWICSAEEFLELYGKEEAVVRNCLLRWSGHLIEVAGTPLFDKSFCFKHVGLFCAPIGAFFRGYPPFPCYTKDFTCKSEVTLNPCISIKNQDYEK